MTAREAKDAPRCDRPSMLDGADSGAASNDTRERDASKKHHVRLEQEVLRRMLPVGSRAPAIASYSSTPFASVNSA